MPIVQCAACGADINKPQNRIDRAVHNFCSHACRGRWMTGLSGENAKHWKPDKPSVSCATCGTPVRPSPSRLQRNKHHFCSRECSGKWKSAHKEEIAWHIPPPCLQPRTPNTKCAYCQKPLFRDPCKFKTTKHFFCGFECRSAWRTENETGDKAWWAWKGGCDTYYGPNWKRQAREARKRDGYKCQHCNVAQSDLNCLLHVHHIKPFRTFNYVVGANENYKKANRLSNLISLCPSCHHKAEPDDYRIQQMTLIRVSRSQHRLNQILARQEKRCPDCQQTKPLSEFSKRRDNPDGLYTYCKECNRARARANVAQRLLTTPPHAEKCCSRCRQNKPASEFHHSKATPGGLHHYCKECRRILKQ